MYRDALQTPFHCGAQVSRIRVTTRSDKVTLSMRSTQIHHLKQLPEEDGWLLFAKYAFYQELGSGLSSSSKQARIRMKFGPKIKLIMRKLWCEFGSNLIFILFF